MSQLNYIIWQFSSIRSFLLCLSCARSSGLLGVCVLLPADSDSVPVIVLLGMITLAQWQVLFFLVSFPESFRLLHLVIFFLFAEPVMMYLEMLTKLFSLSYVFITALSFHFNIGTQAKKQSIDRSVCWK